MPNGKWASFELAERSKIADFLANIEKVKPADLPKCNGHRVTKKSIIEMRSDLMTIGQQQQQDKDFIKVLPAYALYYNISIVVYLHTNLYYKLTPSSDSTNTIYIVKNGRIFEAAEPKLLDEAICIESLEKPLKSAAHYKVDELQQMIQVFGKEATSLSPLKKAEMYELLQKYILEIL